MKYSAIFIFKTNREDMIVPHYELAISENELAYHENDEIDCIIDADTGVIVYENINHYLVKIDEFSFEEEHYVYLI